MAKSHSHHRHHSCDCLLSILRVSVLKCLCAFSKCFCQLSPDVCAWQLQSPQLCCAQTTWDHLHRPAGFWSNWNFILKKKPKKSKTKENPESLRMELPLGQFFNILNALCEHQQDAADPHTSINSFNLHIPKIHFQLGLGSGPTPHLVLGSPLSMSWGFLLQLKFIDFCLNTGTFDAFFCFHSI